MAGGLEYALFSIDLYGWGARICFVFHRPVWLGSSNMLCFSLVPFGRGVLSSLFLSLYLCARRVIIAVFFQFLFSLGANNYLMIFSSYHFESQL